MEHADAKPGGPPGHDTVESHEQWIRNYDYYKCVVCGNIIGKGIGSEFLRDVMKLYPDRTLCLLETPDYAKRNHRFYERNGFIESKKITSDPSLGYGFIIYQNHVQPVI